jgi:hypothetical protein
MVTELASEWQASKLLVEADGRGFLRLRRQ